MSRPALQSLPAGVADAKRLAARLDLPCHDIALHRFPDGEIRVTAGPAGSTTIIYGSLDQPNDKLMTVVFAAEALRRNGAKRLVLVAPYLCYMRQDAAFHEGEAISQRAVGRLLAANVDRVVTVDAHLHRTRDIGAIFPGIEADNLSAMPSIASALRASGIGPGAMVAGPDAESRPWVTSLAESLGLTAMVGRKTRRGDRSVEIDFAGQASPAGRPIVLIDDIVSSGGTLIACARALKAAGAASIDVIVTHALYPPAIGAAFAAAGIGSIRSTSSVPHPTNAIPLDDILAAALMREIGGTDAPETDR